MPEYLASALRHHQAGNVAAAQADYQLFLSGTPNPPEALLAYNNLALALHAQGKLGEAVSCLLQALKINPQVAEIHKNLGNLYRDQGRRHEAIAAYRQALQQQPGDADVYNNLGIALHDDGQLPEAIESYRRALALRQGDARVHNNLALALYENGETEEALARCRKAVEFEPGFAEAWNNLGNCLSKEHRLGEAIESYKRALEIKPDYAEAHYNLGNALRLSGWTEGSFASYETALKLDTNRAAFYMGLGDAYATVGRLAEATVCYRQALAKDANLIEAHNNLGVVLTSQGQFEESINCFRRCLELKADDAGAHLNWGNALKDQGRLGEAIAHFRQALQIQPDHAQAHSNLVYTLHFSPDFDAQALAAELRRWNELHAKPFSSLIQPHGNECSPQRRLRIGYLSPNFRNHVVGQNMLPLLENHDHKNFEIFCYGDHRHPDSLTGRFESAGDEWRATVGLSDEQLAELIRRDGIDILVDLTLHMERNRLLVFARKPAPVQVTFAGYPGSTGLTAVDYRLSDPYLDPVGMDESVYSEKTIRLPESFWCYCPLGAESAVEDLPALSNGFLSLGCFNNFCKVNDIVLALWANVMKAVPTSRLLLIAPEGEPRAHVLRVMEREGIAAGRIDFVPFLPRDEYLKLYHRIDLTLDTLTWNGHTTSLDSLWMGVPVVTLVGDTVVGRAGLSQLTNLGLDKWICQSPEEMAQVVGHWAKDLSALSKLRAELRGRMQKSPLMDKVRFARNVENALRKMWRSWCGA